MKLAACGTIKRERYRAFTPHITVGRKDQPVRRDLHTVRHFDIKARADFLLCKCDRCNAKYAFARGRGVCAIAEFPFVDIKGALLYDMGMITKTKPTTTKIDEQTKLLHLVLQEVRAMRRDFQKAQSADAWLANVPEAEDMPEEGETVIFNADRDNEGKPLTAPELQDILDKIDG
ncbi:MAG: hypothetical protein A3E05_01800 [Candidatus Jacksonbacteria bacterium RIFCSPHIGHO2_12_FULL_44_12]|nr:MAG: hypothetical protein A3E05_01800 [Candidatus Jacksonbacteria bacterium RIFCSPHIGHO2_12_FULL_44_12]